MKTLTFFRIIPFLLLSFSLSLFLSSGCATSKKQNKYWEVTSASTHTPSSHEIDSPPKKSFWEWLFGRKNKTDFSRSIRTNHDIPTEGYFLRPGDNIILLLQGIPAPGQNEDIIDESGYINLPHIGLVKAAGKTSSQLEKEIERLYIGKKIYNRITVSVIVPTKSYTIRGEVKNPGRVQILGRVTLLQAVYAAGGFTEFANPKKITILRGGEVLQKNFKGIEKDPRKDIEILPDDNIRVHRGW